MSVRMSLGNNHRRITVFVVVFLVALIATAGVMAVVDDGDFHQENTGSLRPLYVVDEQGRGIRGCDVVAYRTNNYPIGRYDVTTPQYTDYRGATFIGEAAGAYNIDVDCHLIYSFGNGRAYQTVTKQLELQDGQEPVRIIVPAE